MADKNNEFNGEKQKRLTELIRKATAQKMKFSIKDFFSKCDQIHRKLGGLVTFTEEILNGKLLILCNGYSKKSSPNKKKRLRPYERKFLK